jgi:hypothetical protein
MSLQIMNITGELHLVDAEAAELETIGLALAGRTLESQRAAADIATDDPHDPGLVNNKSIQYPTNRDRVRLRALSCRAVTSAKR